MYNNNPYFNQNGPPGQPPNPGTSQQLQPNGQPNMPGQQQTQQPQAGNLNNNQQQQQPPAYNPGFNPSGQVGDKNDGVNASQQLQGLAGSSGYWGVVFAFFYYCDKSIYGYHTIFNFISLLTVFYVQRLSDFRTKLAINEKKIELEN